MFVRLSRRLVQTRVAQLLVVLSIVFGPIGNLGALQSLASECTTSCPCDAEAPAGLADPCGDHADDDDDAEHHDAEPAEDCDDTCDECDCDRGITSAVAPSGALPVNSSMPHVRPERALDAAPQTGGDDIFIPPRR